MPKNIVLLHGWGASVEKLQPLAKVLEKRDFRVLILKMPGFDIHVPGSAWSLADYSDYVIKQAKKYFKDEAFVVFGHSFGGRVAVKTALLRCRSLKAVILCASGGFSRGNSLKRLVSMILAKVGRVLNIFPPMASFWKKILYKLVREHDYEKLSGVMKETFKNVISEDLRLIVDQIKIPVLILWGKEDRMTPTKDFVFIKNALPAATAIAYDGFGHRLPYENAEQLAINIDQWLSQLR